MLEPFSPVVGWYHSRPSRSSTARLVALDPPFGGLSSPGGSHSGSQPNAALCATAPVRSPRHPRVPWLHAPRSPGAPPHAKARPTCSKSISPRGCRTLRSRGPRRACSSISTSRPSSRRPRAAVSSVWRLEAGWSRRRCLHSALVGGGTLKLASGGHGSNSVRLLGSILRCEHSDHGSAALTVAGVTDCRCYRRGGRTRTHK